MHSTSKSPTRRMRGIKKTSPKHQPTLLSTAAVKNLTPAIIEWTLQGSCIVKDPQPKRHYFTSSDLQFSTMTFQSDNIYGMY